MLPESQEVLTALPESQGILAGRMELVQSAVDPTGRMELAQWAMPAAALAALRAEQGSIAVVTLAVR